MNSIILEPSRFLRRETAAVYHADYLGMYHPQNTLLFLNYLKNDRLEYGGADIAACKQILTDVLAADFAALAQAVGPFTVCGVPRSKRATSYRPLQCGLKESIRAAVARTPNVADGLDYIVRHTDTRTTHRGAYGGSGALPYPGITRDTCRISPAVAGKDIVLVDDIFTPGVGIDDDAVQALYDAGANDVVLYAVGKARGSGTGFRRCA